MTARTIKNENGFYVHVADLKAALDDEAFLLDCAAMIRVAKELGHPALFGVRMCILAAIDGVTGVTAAEGRQDAVRRTIIEGAGPDRRNGH